jgi:hypothetical protein
MFVSMNTSPVLRFIEVMGGGTFIWKEVERCPNVKPRPHWHWGPDLLAITVSELLLLDLLRFGNSGPFYFMIMTEK